MSSFVKTLLAAALCLGIVTAPAQAAGTLGVEEFKVSLTGEHGEVAEQAGSHPFAMTTKVVFDSSSAPGGGLELAAAAKDVWATQMPGLAGNPTAVSTCPTTEFLATQNTLASQPIPACPDADALGTIAIRLAGPSGGGTTYATVYNLSRPPGVASKLGFRVINAPVTIEVGAEESPPYRLAAATTNISQVVEVVSATLTLWGVPADSAHDSLRGRCFSTGTGTSLGKCSAGVSPVPFLTLPRSCTGPLRTDYAADAWAHPGAHLLNGYPDLSDPAWLTGFDETEGEGGVAAGMSGCGKLGFQPEASAQPTSKAATSPSGLDFTLKARNEGLANPAGYSNADLEKAVVTLPQGFTTNPSVAEGLATCSEAQFDAETPYASPGEGPNFAPPGVGCPEAAKVGAVEAETPILEGTLLKGSLFIAAPYANPFGSLIALYMVIKDPQLGIVVKVPLRVESDPVTGQLTTTGENLPPFPVSRFALHFREGTRSPLATPPGCGTHQVTAALYPSSGGAPVTSTSSFEIVSGPNNSPCPTGGLPPFHPGLLAGTLNNAAGRFSPFNVKLTRTDSEQEFTNFSIKLPPGIAGKLAGIPFCSDVAIAAATARTGPHGGQEELDSPSCPAASQVGRTIAGAGVGPSLAYAPGKLYLAGPYHGHPVSLVSITAGVVGPFDIGTVVVRLAIDVNPETGEVFLDSTGSDPIPHIIKGIPVHLRDIRAYTDRPEFTFNPTSCERTSTAATVLGSGLDFVSPADDNPFVSTSPFQAADCAALPFRPKLTLRLKGGTNRGDHPKFTAHLKMAGMSATGVNEAGIAKAQVTLPHSEFLENAHIRTVCTRVQFNAGGGNGEQCPAASIYGRAKAVTPILDAPLEGPVFLRSSEHPLPDLVVALHHAEINIDLVGRVDSVKGGQIRNTFEVVPDAPVSTFDLELQGKGKGLLVNSTNLCKGTHRARADFTGHNGKRHNIKPKLQVNCGKQRKGHKKQGGKKK